MKPLDKISLAEQAAEAIKRRILTHHLQSGERLPSERQLTETLGISRSILREALSALVGQKVVTKVPGKGLFVGDFDRRSLGVHIRLTITDQAELEALRDLRNMLELGALALIVQRITGQELNRLEDLVEEMERQLSRGERINELDTQFHIALFETAHKPALMPLYTQVLRDSTDVSIFQNPQVRDTLTLDVTMTNLSFLRQVLAALRQGDGYGAQQAMKKHILIEHQEG
ncbi:MAG: FadR family transcriptional regulator [Anaerolineae bacterium]|nr:FadR family transcriptional regulator [Anaerolineae bacterium]